MSISHFDAVGLGALALTILGAALIASNVDRLQQQKVLVDQLFEQAPQAVVLLTPEYKVVRVNSEFIQMFGYSREEAIGRDLADLIVPEELQSEVQEIIGLLARGERIQRETVRRRKDGGRLNVSIVHVPVSLPGGQAGRQVATYAIYRDITERKQAEELLQQAHSRIESVLNGVTDVHILFDHEFRYVYVNDAALRTIHRQRDETLGRTLWELFPDLVGTELDRQCRRVMAERVPLAFDFHYPTLDVWWASRVSPTPGGLSVFATDITERKRVEEQLKQSEERFRQMAESVTEVFWMTNPDKRQVLYISPGYEKIWGRTLESVYEHPTDWLEAIHPDDRQRIQKAALTRQILGDYDEEYRIIQPTGSVRWIRDRAFPISDSEGRVYRITGIAEDITDRKLAEEKTKATSAQLRALSARLQSAREKEATRIAREIHDELGAALSSLRWDLEGLEEAVFQRRELSHSGDLGKKIVAMKGLIDATIHSVRRIASELRPTGLDALGLIEAIELHARQFQERTGIVVNCDCDLEQVNLSPEQSTAVFRIFQEALTNILRHAQAKVANIQIREENEVIILKISDDGRGITDEEKSGKRTLGLLGMRERAHLIGGQIEITGSNGEGTVITVSIPIPANGTTWNTTSSE